MSNTKHSDCGPAQAARRATEAGPESSHGGKGRWSAKRKMSVVLELLRGTRHEALEHLRQAMREQFGGFGQGIAPGVKLRHDHGSPFMSDDFPCEVRFLALESSPAFVREPEGNGCIERFFRSLKEQLLWAQRFDTLEELAEALEPFRQRYNEHWLVERLHFHCWQQAHQALLALEAAT